MLDIFDVLDIHLITDKIGLHEDLLPVNLALTKFERRKVVVKNGKFNCPRDP